MRRKQPLVFRQFEPGSQPHAQQAASPSHRFAGGDQAATEAPPARFGQDADARRSASRRRRPCHSATATSRPCSKAPKPPPAAILAAIDSVVSRKRRRRRRGGAALGGECGPDDLRGGLGVRNGQGAHDDGVGLGSEARSAPGKERTMIVRPLHLRGRARQGLAPGMDMGSRVRARRSALRGARLNPRIHERTLTPIPTAFRLSRLAFAAVAGNEP